MGAYRFDSYKGLHMVSINHLGWESVVGKVREDLTIYLINRGSFHILSKEIDYRPTPSIFD